MTNSSCDFKSGISESLNSLTVAPNSSSISDSSARIPDASRNGSSIIKDRSATYNSSRSPIFTSTRYGSFSRILFDNCSGSDTSFESLICPVTIFVNIEILSFPSSCLQANISLGISIRRNSISSCVRGLVSSLSMFSRLSCTFSSYSLTFSVYLSVVADI